MDQNTYLLRFENVTHADANRYAEELRTMLLDATPDIVVQRQRDDSTTQDFGGTLVLVLGTPAVVAVVNAISNWLQSRNKGSLDFQTSDGRISIQNITSKDATKLTQFMLTHQEKESK